ncbi:recombination regulator RecX [Clostridium thailandense]|uniref:recombination regulator RecX n=1 Tax=Clostridium thailandense TaxID=2794346 RepID=UPI003989842B
MKNIITKIEVQKRNKERVNIYINNEFSFACSAELVYIHSLSKDKVVDVNSLAEIVEEDNYIKCKNTSLKMIEKSYKTEKQIIDKLVQKEYQDKIIKRTIEFLKQYNFIDDKKYAQMYIKDKISAQGKNKTKYALINKGINEEIINEELKHIDDAIEESSAMKLAEKKYNILLKSEKDARNINKKLREYLARKGYNLDIIQKVSNSIVKLDFCNYFEENSYKEVKNDIDELYELAEKRYKILVKSEGDSRKLYKKLGDYLLRRGYSWSSIKSVLKNIIEGSDE